MNIQNKLQHGFVKVAALAPQLRVADVEYNAKQIIDALFRAEDEGITVLLCPELCLTSYTCGELFFQNTLLEGAVDGLLEVARATIAFNGIVAVGLPLAVDNKLYNCAAVIHRGKILGIVPKSSIPRYKEFDERWFHPAHTLVSSEVLIGNQLVPIGTDILFQATDVPNLVVGVEICEDLWGPFKPSSFQAVSGATVLMNLSASNELVGKVDYRHRLVEGQSADCIAAYMYASCKGESTTDLVFGGDCMIAENGNTLEQSVRFKKGETMIKAEIDLDRLVFDRMRTNSFGDAYVNLSMPARQYRRATFTVGRPAAPLKLTRKVDAHPFVPKNNASLNERCGEIFNIQVAGLKKRLEYVNSKRVTIGVSGGLDSTLALLVTCKAFDKLGWSRDGIIAYTMPGFGTTSRTKNNAHKLMKQLGVTVREVDIRYLCQHEMRLVGHKPFGIDLDAMVNDVFTRVQPPYGNATPLLDEVQKTLVEEFTKLLTELPDDKRKDLTFENVQARMRTLILMNAGFQIGTGDLSEAAQGWCTYNADHMSGYNPNCSVPKTLVKFLVKWAAETQFEGECRETLLDIVGTEISPELLPAGKDGKVTQKTEDSIGPYELIDFFMYQVLRFGTSPEKILYLAAHADFNQSYSPQELYRWLQSFIKRFFSNQFKRSCMPDGPKVGSVSLSPRVEWRMPSDAECALWLKWTGNVVEISAVLAQIMPAPDNTQTKETATMNAVVDISDAALLIVDELNDFGSKGNLPVQNGEDTVAPTNRIQPLSYKRVAIRDKHPQNHGSFASNHPGKRVFDKINLNGVEDQDLWPDHCVEGTYGAEFFADLDTSHIDCTVYKGTDPRVDSYSGFFANDKKTPTTLHAYLKAEKIGKVVVVGLATDYCVKFTAFDAVKLGYETYLVKEACRGLTAERESAALLEMAQAGVRVISISSIKGISGGAADTTGFVAPPPAPAPTTPIV